MGILALRSASIPDILDASRRGGWTHTCKSRFVRDGDTVIVFANMGECRRLGITFENQVVLVGKMVGRPYNVPIEDWPSSDEEQERVVRVRDFRARFDLSDMEYRTFDEFPEVLRIILGTIGHMNGGKYID